MPKMFSSKEIEKVLQKLNFLFQSQKGSHARYKNNNGLTVILPMNKKEIPDGTYRSILKQMSISKEQFEHILK
ncbi:MAG TPA: type II toxin-antitoxin system HicA family toxin [bacterium]|nr:type II toxin-antitoxin system HicA family toxin [bacterium]